MAWAYLFLCSLNCALSLRCFSEIHLGGEHVNFFDGVHPAFHLGLGTLLVLTLIGDHLFDQCICFGDREVEEGSSSSSIYVGSGNWGQPVVEAL